MFFKIIIKGVCADEEVVAAMEEELGASITFERPRTQEDEMLRVRERINRMIAEKLN